MTDKELLELAAKAAGIELIPMETKNFPTKGINHFIGFMTDSSKIDFKRGWFNPLTDDGDALRLAVKLGAIIGTYANYSTVDLLTPNERIETIKVWHSSAESDPYAATRRAIVRAAAAIGEMK